VFNKTAKKILHYTSKKKPVKPNTFIEKVCLLLNIELPENIEHQKDSDDEQQRH